jgi:hypothetical protein
MKCNKFYTVPVIGQATCTIFLTASKIDQEAFTSPLTLGCKGLFPRCVKRTGHEVGHSPTSADVKSECRSTSTPPYFITVRYIIRYMDRPGNLSQRHGMPQHEDWGNTACQTSTAKMTQCALLSTVTQAPTYLLNYSAMGSADKNRSHKNMAKNKTNYAQFISTAHPLLCLPATKDAQCQQQISQTGVCRLQTTAHTKITFNIPTTVRQQHTNLRQAFAECLDRGPHPSSRTIIFPTLTRRNSAPYRTIIIIL